MCNQLNTFGILMLNNQSLDMYGRNMHMQRVDLKQVQREIHAKQSSVLNIKGSSLD